MTARVFGSRQYVLIWAALLALLGLTLGLAEIDLGAFNNLVALLIAAAKTLLVVLFFMHVRYEKPLTWLFVCAGLLWLVIMFDLTMSDYLTRPAPIHDVLGNTVRSLPM